MKQYLRGSTPKIKTKIYDSETGLLVTPATSVKVFVVNPVGVTQAAAASMSQYGTSTGVYYYAGWTVPDTALAGTYRYTVIVTDGAYISKQEGEFEVLERGTT